MEYFIFVTQQNGSTYRMLRKIVFTIYNKTAYSKLESSNSIDFS